MVFGAPEFENHFMYHLFHNASCILYSQNSKNGINDKNTQKEYRGKFRFNDAKCLNQFESEFYEIIIKIV